MDNILTLGVTTDLPTPPAGWFDYGYAILCDGSLALARIDCDIHQQVSRWRQRQAEDPWAIAPSLEDALLLLSKFDGNTESGAANVPPGYWPKFDCLADGRWVVTSIRAEPGEENACLFAADGTPAGGFAMGDAIKHLRCAPDGTIWVGYFDEGVFASIDENGNWPVRRDWFNAKDSEFGNVIETEEREDICAVLEELAFAARQKALVSEIDEWRDW